MPIPTDTFWNTRRLNIVFAVSAVLMMLTLVWATFQDFFQPWREPQRQGNVWEAALVDERIERDLTPEKEAQIAALRKQEAELLPAYGPDAAETRKRAAVLRELQSDLANLEFALNTLKAEAGVMESQLQDAITAGDQARVRELTRALQGPRERISRDTEAMAALKEQIAQARRELDEHTAPLDEVQKEIARLTADIEALRKKRAALVPKGLIPRLSNQLRETPLMQFINPATRVKQVVLPDVRTSLGGVKEVESIDRCITCHVNIANKDFAEEKVLAYLEEQVASSREYPLPETTSGRASDPAATRSAPGAAAMPEFWHLYAAAVAPEVVKRPASQNRIKTLAASVGKQATVTVDGKKLASFSYAADPQKTEGPALDQRMRDVIVAELLKAYIGYPKAPRSSSNRVKVTIDPKLSDKELNPLRVPALKYVEDLKPAVMAALPEEMQKLLNDRYRRAMVAEANVAREKRGLRPLDPSPVMLAHPRLDLYVDIDSKHSIETVGCTSCHDGSGFETNFVLAAHTPRPIWVDQKTGAPVLPGQVDKSKLPDFHHDEDLSSMLAAVWPKDEVAPTLVSDLHLHPDDDAHAAHAAHAAPTTKPAHGKESAAEHELPPAPTEPEPAKAIVPVAYVDPLTGQSGRAVPQMRYWMEEHEPGAPRGFKLVYHEWDWPMRPPRYLQANCVRCHNDVNSIKEEAPKVFEGRSLFIQQGCVNCHQMDSIPADSLPENPSDVRLIAANGQRKVGTDLRNVTAKLSPSFLNTWIWAPKAFRPSTKMPHFFMLENNSSDEEIRRTRQEARAITEYLVRTANTFPQTGPKSAIAQAGDAKAQATTGPLPPEHMIPPGGKGSIEAGRAIFTSIGCQGCHTNLNDPSGDKRGDKPVTLAEKWIVTDLVKSGDLAREMEEELGKGPDSKSLAARATEMYDRMSYNQRQLYVSEKLSANYHGEAEQYPDGTPKPIFQNHGPELSGIGTKLLAGRSPEDARQWLFDWLKDPRHYSEYTVMPDLRLSDQQALDVVEYLLAQKRTNDKPDDPWRAELTEPDTQKLIELTSLFLRSRFSAQRATERADDDAELLTLATDALTTANTPSDVARAQAANLTKDQQRMVFLGKKLISHYGCMNCHAINGTEQMTSPCVNLSDWGQKSLSQIAFEYLDHHKAESLPPTHKLELVNGLSAEAATLTSPDYRAQSGAGKVAKAVEVAWPHVGHSRTDWLTQKLKNTRIYDRGKVLLEPSPKENDPGKPYDKLKMPTFYFNDREVDAIVTWVIANRFKNEENWLISNRLLAEANNPQAQRIARGRQVVQKLNCVGCHVIDGNAPSVHQFFKAGDITTKAPPSLRGEGNKIQHTWLFNFLKHVEPLRPLIYDGIRMPSFYITDEEATAIAAYFNAESVKESRKLKQQLDPVQKYVQAERESAMKLKVDAPANPTTLPAATAERMVDSMIEKAGALIADKQLQPAVELLSQANAIATAQKLSEPVGATTRPVSNRLQTAIKELESGQIPAGIPWPGDAWYERPELAAAAENLKQWALGHGLMREIQFDTTRLRPEDIVRSHRLLLMEAEFVRRLFDSPYPFVDTPRPEISEERFKKGEALFYEMQCLKCHVLGDPSVEGAQKNPTAPNLTLTHRRLQRRWVRHWVQEPDIIQLQTAMPPFFTGKPVFDSRGQSWPRAQSTQRPAEQIEADYGQTVDEQADLLLDFLYAAGVSGHTGIQPAAAPPPTPQVQQRDPAEGVAPTPPATPTQPFRPGDATKGTAAEPPGAPSPKSPQEAHTPPGEPAGVDVPKGAPVQPPSKMQPTAPKAEEKKVAAKAPAKAGGDVSVKGMVLIEGEAPEMPEIDMSGVHECAVQHADPVYDPSIIAGENGELKNVVLSISGGLPQQQYDPPAEAAVLDQQGCMYEPHVLAVMVGQKIAVKNSDAFLHNVNAQANENVPFNLGQPGGAENVIEPLRVPEAVRVKCDVHPWMSAYIVAVDHPFFAVSGEDGSFNISNLPPGEYTLRAWHERLGTQEVPVKVEAGKPAQVQIKFAAP